MTISRNSPSYAREGPQPTRRLYLRVGLNGIRTARHDAIVRWSEATTGRRHCADLQVGLSFPGSGVSGGSVGNSSAQPEGECSDAHCSIPLAGTGSDGSIFN